MKNEYVVETKVEMDENGLFSIIFVGEENEISLEGLEKAEAEQVARDLAKAMGI